MTFATLLYETQGRIACITLNRPERLNAIDEKIVKRGLGDVGCDRSQNKLIFFLFFFQNLFI